MRVSRACLTGILVIMALAGCSSVAVGPPGPAASPPAPGAGRARQARPAPRAAPATPLDKILAGGVEQATYTFGYDPAYVKLTYPGGDVPLDRGVCADVIVRAFRQGGVDLQKEVHEDMAAHFSAYPRNWGARRPDRNIDHRRVANLMTYFERRGKALTISDRAEDYLPGDVVAWDLGNGRLHIGLVTDVKAENASHYAVVHNISAGARIEDVLFAWRVVGRYRYFHAQQPAPAVSGRRGGPSPPNPPGRARRRSRP